MSQQGIEQISRQDDKEGDGGEEYRDETQGHYLFEQSGFGKRETYYRHHEGYGSAEGNALCHEYLNDRHYTRSIGIHWHCKDNTQRNGIPVVARHILLEEALGNEAVRFDITKKLFATASLGYLGYIDTSDFDGEKTFGFGFSGHGGNYLANNNAGLKLGLYYNF